MVKADCCGKFRSNKDVFYSEDYDGYGYEVSGHIECRFCCSLVDEERHFNNKAAIQKA